MQRTAAAGAEQGVAPRILAALGDMHARGTRHVLIDDVVDAPGELLHAQSRLVGDGGHGRPRGREVDFHRPAGEKVGIEIAEQEIGVGHRRPRSTQSIGRRAGFRPRAFRAHLQQADRIQVCDRAATRANLDELDGRDADRQAGALGEPLLARRLEMIGDQRFAAVDDGELRRRAAHVEGQHVAAGILRAEPGGGECAGCRPGFEKLHRYALRLAQIGEAAVGDHHQQRRRDAPPGQLRRDRIEIGAGQRLDIGVGDRGGGTLELADLGCHVAGGADAQLREPLRDQGRRPPLVRRFGIGVEEHDRDRLCALPHEAVHRFRQRRLVERRADHSARVDALRHLDPQVAGDKRRRLLDMHVVEFVLPLAADLEHVAEALGGHQSGYRTLALDHRIGEERRRMDDPADAPGRHAVLAQDALDARNHAPRRIVMCRQNLAAEAAAFPMIVDDDVGEGAADIDAEREAAVGILGHGVRYLPFPPFSFPFLPFAGGRLRQRGRGSTALCNTVQHFSRCVAQAAEAYAGLGREAGGFRFIPFPSLLFLFLPSAPGRVSSAR